MWDKIQETIEYVNQRTSNFKPSIGLVLGSGLGSFVDQIQVNYAIPYQEIPNFPTSTVPGHQGYLIFGTIGNKAVIAMQGRFHYYEGYNMHQVTFPIRVMKYLGISNLIVSNASGGVNPGFKVGDIMIIKDHINAFPEHPLRGKNDQRLGPRFLNMHQAYCPDLINLAKKISSQHNIPIQEGVYYGLQGPSFETLAEYKMIYQLGADCVGMSTVPEVIVAKHMDLPCFGVSIISDMGNEQGITNLSHDEVLKAVKNAEPHVKRLIKNLVLNI